MWYGISEILHYERNNSNHRELCCILHTGTMASRLPLGFACKSIKQYFILRWNAYALGFLNMFAIHIQCISLSIYLSVYLSIDHSICLSIGSSIHLFTFLSLYCTFIIIYILVHSIHMCMNIYAFIYMHALHRHRSIRIYLRMCRGLQAQHIITVALYSGSCR